MVMDDQIVYDHLDQPEDQPEDQPKDKPEEFKPTPIHYADTCVLWDTQDYPLPDGLTPSDVTKNIESVLREKGFLGQVSVTPYFSVNDTSPRGGYDGFSVCIVDDEGNRDARIWQFAVHLLGRSIDHRHRKLNLMLILGDISKHMGLLRTIHFLKSRCILTQPQGASGQPFDKQWLCTSLSAGERLIKQIGNILINQAQPPQQLFLSNCDILPSTVGGEVRGTFRKLNLLPSPLSDNSLRIKGKGLPLRHVRGRSQ